jgi:predicted O-methyltransferase YrrM
MNSLYKKTMQWIDRLPGWRMRQALRRAWSRLPNGSMRVFVEPYTMLSPERLGNLERAVRTVVRERIPGDVIECGTCEGGSAALMALWLRRLQSDRKVHVFDTFEGLPPATTNDPDFDRAIRYTGACRGELQQVRGLFEQLGVADRAVFIKGLFQDTFPTYEFPPLAVLHLDADWYDSTMVCLEHLWDRVSPGGIIQIDDYGAWQGCRKAVDEFFAARKITEKLRDIDGSGIWLRKAAACAPHLSRVV